MNPTKTIKIALVKREMSVGELSRRIGRDISMVSQVINQRIKGRPTLALIAKELDLDYEKLLSE